MSFSISASCSVRSDPMLGYTRLHKNGPLAAKRTSLATLFRFSGRIIRRPVQLVSAMLPSIIAISWLGTGTRGSRSHPGRAYFCRPGTIGGSVRGAGSAGYQLQLPVSTALSDAFVVHTNLGATRIPRARSATGDRATLNGWNIGQSLIWLAAPRFNVMLEWVYARMDIVSGPGIVSAERSNVLSPGVRWAYNRPSGLQIVPGIAVPIGIGSSRGDNGIIFYVSFEHPLR